MRNKSKLVRSMKIDTKQDFSNFLKIIKPEPIWTAIYYDIFINCQSYKNAGAPFGISKMNIYDRLKNAKKRLEESDGRDSKHCNKSTD
jgi:hypothetical protein